MPIRIDVEFITNDFDAPTKATISRYPVTLWALQDYWNGHPETRQISDMRTLKLNK